RVLELPPRGAVNDGLPRIDALSAVLVPEHVVTDDSRPVQRRVAEEEPDARVIPLRPALLRRQTSAVPLASDSVRRQLARDEAVHGPAHGLGALRDRSPHDAGTVRARDSLEWPRTLSADDAALPQVVDAGGPDAGGELLGLELGEDLEETGEGAGGVRG